MAGRGRPKGSKNNAAPNPDAIPGHNKGPGDLTDEQRKALTFMSKRDYKAALEKKKAADAYFKNTCKRIKSDGVSVERIKHLIQLEEPAGERALREKIEEYAESLRWVGVEVGQQTDLFPVDRRPSEDKAFEEGKIAGMEGREPRPPYDTSVPQFQSWQDGWHEGQAVNRSLLAGMKKPDEDVENEMSGDEPRDADDDE